MIKVRHKMKQPFVKSIVKTYTDFAQHTSIHGLKYTVEKNSSTFEKAIWIAVICLGLVGSMFMLNLFWMRFSSNPTRSSVLTSYAGVNEIPFPAITICPINKIRRSKLNIFIKSLNLSTTDEVHLEKIFPGVWGYTNFQEYNSTDLENLERILLLNGYDNATDVIRTVGQNCTEMLVKCSWEGKEYECSKYFIESMSPTGLCCSFNYNHGDMKITTYFGHQMGLNVLIDPMIDDKQHLLLNSLGMKVTIHHPYNYPEIGNIEKILAIGRETFLQLSGTRYVCSDEVKDLTQSQRRCILPNEEKLEYFHEYTEENCLVQCRAKYINEKCKCFPYYFNFSGGPYCNISSFTCVVQATKSELTKKNGHFCDCQTQCEDVFYDVLSTSTKLVHSQYVTSWFLNGVNVTDSSILLHVFFHSQTQTILLRDTITSVVYLLSSFGGIFSLFLGCSFITGAEIIYYISIRFFFNLKVSTKVAQMKVEIKRRRLPVKGNLNSDFIYHGSQNDKIYTLYKNTYLE